MLRMWCILFVFVWAIFGGGPCRALEHPYLVSEKYLKDELAVAGYVVRIYYDPYAIKGALRILRDGAVRFEEEGTFYEIGLRSNDDQPVHALIRKGLDLTGDGTPNIVVHHWTWGMHCCYTVYVFSLGEDVRLIDTFDVQDDSLFTFEDIDHDGSWEFLTRDYTFAYWNASFAGSPAPLVILRYEDGRYRLALDLMASPLPDPVEEFKAMVRSQEWCAENTHAWRKAGTCVTSPVWGYMLELIYTGHPREAWEFLDRAWSGSADAKLLFIRDFKDQLALSPYASELPVDLREIRSRTDAARTEAPEGVVAQTYSMYAAGDADTELVRRRVATFNSLFFGGEGEFDGRCMASH